MKMHIHFRDYLATDCDYVKKLSRKDAIWLLDFVKLHYFGVGEKETPIEAKRQGWKSKRSRETEVFIHTPMVYKVLNTTDDSNPLKELLKKEQETLVKQLAKDLELLNLTYDNKITQKLYGIALKKEYKEFINYERN